LTHSHSFHLEILVPDGSLAIGQSLQIEQTLVSAQGIFVLGFFTNGDNTYLGIWYNYMKPQSIVWVANRDNPIKGGNASLALSQSSLDLLDTRKERIPLAVWFTDTLTNSPQAFLLDSGNLIINDTSMSGTGSTPSPLWQSFDHPCDTWLSGMRIGYDTLAHNNFQLRSWKSDSDPSSGDYSIGLDPSRLPGLVLRKGDALQYRTGPWNGQGFNGQPYLMSTSNVAFNMTVREGSILLLHIFEPIHPVAHCPDARWHCLSQAQQCQQRVGGLLALSSVSV
jgi:hypothetical protein